MKHFLKFVIHYTYRPLIEFYLKRERKFSYKKMNFRVLPGVFHPGLFFSTKFLCDFLENIELKNKKVLELGAGSGVLSVFCVKRGATVTASDISLTCILNIDKNSRRNRVHITAVHSDLFNEMPKQFFDIILINPPYYKKNPTKDSEYAWYCGENMEYFSRLFKELSGYILPSGYALMVLSDACDVDAIKLMCKDNNLSFEEVGARNFLLEKNFIFEIKRLA